MGAFTYCCKAAAGSKKSRESCVALLRAPQTLEYSQMSIPKHNENCFEEGTLKCLFETF